MADVVSSSKRSQMMSFIKGKNSLPEMLVRKSLFGLGYRFRLHRFDLPGTPDIVIPRQKIAIFVHGCFWHAHQGCKYAKTPSTRTDFRTAELKRLRCWRQLRETWMRKPCTANKCYLPRDSVRHGKS